MKFGVIQSFHTLSKLPTLLLHIIIILTFIIAYKSSYLYINVKCSHIIENNRLHLIFVFIYMYLLIYVCAYYIWYIHPVIQRPQEYIPVPGHHVNNVFCPIKIWVRGQQNDGCRLFRRCVFFPAK